MFGRRKNKVVPPDVIIAFVFLSLVEFSINFSKLTIFGCHLSLSLSDKIEFFPNLQGVIPFFLIFQVSQFVLYCFLMRLFFFVSEGLPKKYAKWVF